MQNLKKIAIEFRERKLELINKIICFNHNNILF